MCIDAREPLPARGLVAADVVGERLVPLGDNFREHLAEPALDAEERANATQATGPARKSKKSSCGLHVTSAEAAADAGVGGGAPARGRRLTGARAGGDNRAGLKGNQGRGIPGST